MGLQHPIISGVCFRSVLFFEMCNWLYLKAGTWEAWYLHSNTLGNHFSTLGAPCEAMGAAGAACGLLEYNF